MKPWHIASLVGVCAVLAASGARAQTAADPSGHWEGGIDAPRGRVAFEVDIARGGDGALTGTMTLPAEHVTGLPLARVTLDGNTVTFSARSDQVLAGVLSADGKSMSGTFTVTEGSAPFSAARTGDARMPERPRIASVAHMFAGRWDGTLEAERPLHLVLTLTNHPDGTASGQIVNLDEGGLTIPVSAMSTAGSQITMAFNAIGGTYTATINSDGTEMTGTLKQGGANLALTFRRND